MRRSTINKLNLLLFCLLFAACSGTKHLPAGEKLYTGAEIKLESANTIKNKNSIKTIAKNAIRPLPNQSFLWMRPKLWFNSIKLLNKWGEPPVVISQVNPALTCTIIDAKFFNIGIFNSYTEYKIVEKKHTAKVIYISHIHAPYTIKDLIISVSDDSINHILLSDKARSFLTPGVVYNLDLLKTERTRIDVLLKNKGYFYFSPDYLLFKADTSEAKQTISFRLTLKDSIPQNALTTYRIGKVYIDQNYSLNANLDKETENTIKPGIILRSIYLKKGETYSRKDHDRTLNRLMSMGNFKFASIKFTNSDTIIPGFLDVNILLTPLTKRTFRAEFDFISKSNNFMGPQINLNYLNRNTFQGAELLNLNLAGSFEAQFGKTNLFSYSLAPQAELYFPDIMIPFKIIRTNGLYAPKTRFSLSYNYIRRVNYFDMSTLQFIYGFKWKDNISKEQALNPIMVSYASITNSSAKFQELLAANPFLKKSYEEQFIAGGSYSFTYNEQVGPEKKMQYFFQLNTEAAGNAFSLVKLIAGDKSSSDYSSKAFGSIYSQYAKLSIEGRGYYNFINKNKVVLRIFAGIAKPYGNSSVLPYSKQFFCGGPNSLRAFPINSVGPGTYQQSTDNSGLLQLGGDLKLETNAEYRFNIIRYFKGALFVDAGNIWLLESSPTLSVNPFSFSKFADEIAVGAGIGLRVDLSFFVLRFDLATPLRKPWLEANQRWVINQINFENHSWRKDNLVLNVAIGYPF